MAHLQALQQSVATLHGLEQTLLHEIRAIKAAQTEQANKLEQVAKAIARGRWWRRLTLALRLLVIGGIVAAVLYFLADWQALFQFFV